MKWHIRSSSGRNQVSVEFKEQREDGDGRVFVVGSMAIQGMFWWRLSKEFEGEVVEDFTVTLHQVVFWKEQLEELLRQLDAWFQQPSQILLRLTSGADSGQNLTISIGKNEELLSSVERPACTIEYSSGTFQFGKWSFVIDQSCIRLLADELSEALRGFKSEVQQE